MSLAYLCTNNLLVHMEMKLQLEFNFFYCKSSSKIIASDVRWCSPHQNTDSSLVWCTLWHHVLISYFFFFLLHPPPHSFLFLFSPPLTVSPTFFNPLSPPLSVSLSVSLIPHSSNHGQKTGAEGSERSMWALHCSIDDPMIPCRTEPVRQTEWGSTQNQNLNQRHNHSVKATNWTGYEW